MKPRHILLTTSLIGALAGATTSFANPLGIVSGGAGVFGALGGTLSGPSANPTLGVGSAIGAAGQFQGAIAHPNLVIDPSLAGRAHGIVHSTGNRARSRVEGAGEATVNQSTSVLGGIEAATAAAAETNAAGRVPGVNAVRSPLRVRPLRSLDAGVSAGGEASGSANATSPSTSTSAEVDGSAQAQAQVNR